MPSRLAALPLLLTPGAASAHAGHWGPSAGHDHWIALGVLGALGLAGLAALAKERRRRQREEDAATADDAPEAEA